MTNPSPICTVQDGGGAPQATTNGVNVTGSNTITIALVSTAGVNTWSLTIAGQDESVVAPTITVNNTTKTATYTASSGASSLILKSVVNGGVDVNGAVQPSYTTTFKVCVPTASGQRLLASGEQLENSATFGWTGIVNAPLRSGGAGTVSIGSGTAIDCSLASTFIATPSTGTTYTFSNFTDGQVIILDITMTGSHTVAFTSPGGTTITMPGGSQPTQTASGTDTWTFAHLGSKIRASVSQAQA